MGLGRLIGKAAAGAAPIVTQKWRDEVDAQREATLQKYRQQENASNQAHNAEQNRLSREQNAAQHSATLAQDQTQFDANLQATTQNQADQLALETQRVNKLIEQIDLEMESTNLDIGAKRALQQLQSALAEAETPEEQTSLITRIMGMDGKERDPDFKFIEGTAIDPESAEKISTLIRVNPRTGEYDFIGSGGASAAGGIPSEALADLMAVPAAERETADAEFDEIFGAGAAAQARQQRGGAPAAAPAPQQPAAATQAPAGLLDLGMGRAATQQQQRLPPGEGVRRRGASTPAAEPASSEDTDADVLEGYTMPGPTLGNQIAGAARKVGEYQRGAESANRESKVGMVVDQLKPILDSKDLRPLVGIAEEDIELAIASGKLNEQQVRVLRAFLNEQ